MNTRAKNSNNLSNDYSDVEVFEIESVSNLKIDILKTRLNLMNVTLSSIKQNKNYYVDLYMQALSDPEKKDILVKHLDSNKDSSIRSRSKSRNKKFINSKRLRSKDDTNSHIESQNGEISPCKSKASKNNISNLETPKHISETKLIASNVKTHSVKLSTAKKAKNGSNLSEMISEQNIPVAVNYQSRSNERIYSENPQSKIVRTQTPGGIKDIPLFAKEKGSSSNSLLKVNHISRSNTSLIKQDIEGEVYGYRHSFSQPANKEANFFKNEFIQASNRSSSNSLVGVRTNISNSIQNTFIPCEAAEEPIQLEESELIPKESKVLTWIKSHFDNLKPYLKTILAGTSLGGIAGYLGYKIYQNYPREQIASLYKKIIESLPEIKLAFPDCKDIFNVLFMKKDLIGYSDEADLVKISIPVLGLIIAGAAYILKLKKNNLESEKRENIMIAENILEQIKQFLNDGKKELEVDLFINEYCSTNEMKEGEFKEKVLPYISESVKVDELIEEAFKQFDENDEVKAIWRLKSQD